MDALDWLLRRVLALPGLVFDWLDGAPAPPGSVAPAEVYAIVTAHARWPEAHLALERGLHYFVAQGRLLAYQLRGGTAFAIGGLNAGPTERISLLQGFVAAMAIRGIRRRLVFPLRREELEDAAAAGFRAVEVGIEAWVDLADFDLRGKRWAHTRQMCNRAARRGVVVEETTAGAHAGALAMLHAAWLDAKRPQWRMRLLVGSPGLDEPFNRRYFIAQGPHRIEAFVTVLPGRDGHWGLDVMCRRPDAAPGAMEALVTHVAKVLKAEGSTALSLGACPMAGVRSATWAGSRAPAPSCGAASGSCSARASATASLTRFARPASPRRATAFPRPRAGRRGLRSWPSPRASTS